MSLSALLIYRHVQYANYIGPAGVNALVKSLEEMTRLQKLELVSCGFVGVEVKED